MSASPASTPSPTGPLPVILLAAGRGERLRPLTDERPKAMVEVGGEPMAARALRALRAAGLTRIVAVTGWRAEAFDELDVEQRHNREWDTANNVVSLWSVRDLVRGGAIVVNSDVVFGRAIAEAVAGAHGTALAVDGSHELDDEAMKASESGGRLVALSKQVPIDEAAGEYIGLLRVDPSDGSRLADILDALVAGGETDVYYEEAFARLADERVVRLVRVDGEPWAEIDDHRDLERAEAEVAPRV